MKLFRALAPTVAALAVVLLTVSLGNWQTRRAAEKLQLHEQRDLAETQAPTALEMQPLADADVPDLEGRRLAVRGRLLDDRSIFVENRTHKGIAGFHVLTPLRIEGVRESEDAGDSERVDGSGDTTHGRAAGGHGPEAMHVLVLRGWVAHDRADRTRLPSLSTPGGAVELIGIAQRDLAQVLELKRSPPPGPSQRIWQNLSLDAYADWSGLRLQPLLIRQTEPLRRVDGSGAAVDDGLVRDWPQPGTDVDKHRGYAFQWYAMTLTTVVLWAWFVVLRPMRPMRARRRDANAGDRAG